MEPLTACGSEIDACDLFIGLYAHRYGYVPAGALYSITEQEFQWARDQHKPLFCYLVDDAYAWPLSFKEGPPGASQLLAFKQVIRSTLVVDVFQEPLDLAVKVATAVGRHLLSHQTLLAVPANTAQERQQREALSALLEARKDGVLAALRSNPAQQQYFLSLHTRNIEAIHNGELLLSHLLTSDIHLLLGLVKSEIPPLYVKVPGESAPKALPQEPPPRPEYPYVYDPREARIYRTSTHLRPEAPPASAADDPSSNAHAWREQLLRNWLARVLEPLQAALAERRRIAALEREAEARGVLSASRSPKGRVVCPHCEARFETSAQTAERVRCPQCRTHITVVEQVTPIGYEGHQMVDDVCTKCGCSLRSIQRFHYKCK
jgi:hypothetical protein